MRRRGLREDEALTNETEQAPPAGEPPVKVARPRDGVALMTITSTPLGVLRLSVKRAMRAALCELDADPAVRCLVLTGCGKAFSVGSDIRDFQRDGGWLLEAEFEENALNDHIEGARYPVIAACNGHTLGGGAVLALACDLRIAAASASFGLPEVKVGAFASGSGTQRLARLLGRGQALYLLLTGRTMSADEALRRGIFEEVVPDDALFERALDLAEEIAALPASAIAPPSASSTPACATAGRPAWRSRPGLRSRSASARRRPQARGRFLKSARRASMPRHPAASILSSRASIRANHTGPGSPWRLGERRSTW